MHNAVVNESKDVFIDSWELVETGGMLLVELRLVVAMIDELNDGAGTAAVQCKG